MQYKITTRQPIYPIGPSISYIPLTKGLWVLCDWEDATFLSQWNWSACKSRTDDNFYARRRMRINDDHRNKNLHQLLLRTSDGNTVDHRNGNSLDNRRCNLRLATHAQQSWNRRLQKSNRSGYKGVYWNKQARKWHACCTSHNKRNHLGFFDIKEDAAQAYILAAYLQHGEFIRLT